MDFGGETDVRRRIGYSISDPAAKASWVALVGGLRDFITANDLQDEIVFHGTSYSRAKMILKQGMKPTDVRAAVWDQCDDVLGSFWGSLDAAVCYAEDTASKRTPKSAPVILVALVADLEGVCELRCDGATLDFPLRGLTQLENPIIDAKWRRDISGLSWKDSLVELGAIVAIHSENLKLNLIEIVDEFDGLKEIMDKRKFGP